MERLEALAEILENMNINLNNIQIKELEEAFSVHIEMEAEMESYQHIRHNEKCLNCETLKKEISGLRYEVEIYQEGVKKRHPRASYVYIEDGDVKYDL